MRFAVHSFMKAAMTSRTIARPKRSRSSNSLPRDQDGQFIAPRPGRTIHCNRSNKKLQLQVDIFCRDMVTAVRAWRAAIPETDTTRQARLDELAAIQIDGLVRF